MKRLIMGLGLVLWSLSSSCARLRPDPVMSAVDAGASTAEIWANHVPMHGLGVVSVMRGEPLKALELGVQTYYQGQVRMDSKECGIAITQRYSRSERVEIPVSGPASTSCIISVVVSPEYPSQLATSIKVYPFTGHVYVRMIEQGEDWIGSKEQVQDGFSKPLEYFIGSEFPVRAVFTGCGKEYDQVKDLENGRLKIDLNEIAAPELSKPCVVEGIVISKEYKNLLITHMVERHSSMYTSLAIPKLNLVNGRLSIVADPSVSIMSIDSRYLIASRGRFSFDDTKPHIMRLLTVKARSLIGVFTPDKGWSWDQ